MKYLTKFGYLSPHAYSDKSVTDAIQKYQKTFGLEVTGEANEETLKLMNTPRCGLADHGAEYAMDTRWRKQNLTYYFYNFSPDLPNDRFRSMTKAALDTWAEVALLNFTEVAANGDIVVAYGPYYHEDDKKGQCMFPFDGPSGVLAHAFFPEDGRIHFDDSETFTEKSQYGINYLWVATHELGHTLGLRHDTTSRDAVMFPYYREYNPHGMYLHVNDVYRIRQLYGTRGNKQGVYTQPPYDPVTYPHITYPTQEPITECKCCDKANNCKENKKRCRGYSDNWTDWMRKHCKETCGLCGPGPEPTDEPVKPKPKATTAPSCVDMASNCGSMLDKCFSAGENWTQWMKKYCPFTCGFCGDPRKPKGCEDSDPMCPSWKDRCQGYAKNWTEYMKENCRVTCGYCSKK